MIKQLQFISGLLIIMLALGSGSQAYAVRQAVFQKPIQKKPLVVNISPGKNITVTVPGRLPKSPARIVEMPSKKGQRLAIIKDITVVAGNLTRKRDARQYLIKTGIKVKPGSYMLQFNDPRTKRWVTMGADKIRFVVANLDNTVGHTKSKLPAGKIQSKTDNRKMLQASPSRFSKNPKLIKQHHSTKPAIEIVQGQIKRFWVPGNDRAQARLVNENAAVKGTEVKVKGLNNNRTKRQYEIRVHRSAPIGAYTLQRYSNVRNRWERTPFKVTIVASIDAPGRITRVIPANIESGDIVTLAGQGLGQKIFPVLLPYSRRITDSYPCDGPDPDSGYIYQEESALCVRWDGGMSSYFISLDNSDSTRTNKLMSIRDWSASPDGRSATFKAGGQFIYSKTVLNSNGDYLLSANMLPVSGKLRMSTITYPSNFTINPIPENLFNSIGPEVTWNKASMKLDATYSIIDSQQSDAFNKSFNFAYRNRPQGYMCPTCNVHTNIHLRGSRVLSSSFYIGDTLIAGSLGSERINTEYNFKLNLLDDVISGNPRIEKNGESATGVDKFYLLRFPELSNDEYKHTINNRANWSTDGEVVLNGRALNPTVVPGLRHHLSIRDDSDNPLCGADFNIIEHSNSKIIIKFTSASLPRPSSCRTDSSGWLDLSFIFNNTEKVIWSIPYAIWHH